MEWLKQNAKTVTGTLIILILIEAVLAWYMIDQFRENYLSGEEALVIALEDAGYERDAVRKIDIDLETEKGTAWYEVEFRLSDPPGTEFSYHIDAETGEILSARAS